MWMLPLPADLRESFLMLPSATFLLIQLQCYLMPKSKNCLNLHVIPKSQKLTNSNSHSHVRLRPLVGLHFIQCFGEEREEIKFMGDLQECLSASETVRINIYYNPCFSFHSPTLKVQTVMLYNLLEADVSVDLEYKQPYFFHDLTNKKKKN